MDDLLIFLAAVAVIWLFVLLAYKRFNLSKRGFVFVKPFPAVMWKTTKGTGVIDQISQKFARGWRVYGTFAAVVGIAIMVFVFVLMLLNAIILISTPSITVPGIRFVLPGLIPGLSILMWLFAVGVVLVIHEFFHGILLRAQNLKTKFVGLLLLLFIPGAFVEPDEKELMKARPSKRIRMFAAGPMSNVVASYVFIGLIILLVAPKPGVHVYSVAHGFPLENIENQILGARIVSLNGVNIDNVYTYVEFMAGTEPGDNVFIIFDNGEGFFFFTATLENSPTYENQGSLGVLTIRALGNDVYINPLNLLNTAGGAVLGGPVFHQYAYTSPVPWFVIDSLKWLFTLNLLVGIFNLLPMIPFDGGYIFEAVLEFKISRKNAKRAARIISLFVFLLILMNIVPAIRGLL